jgi:polysaccharide export outer membrane protein
MNSRIAMTCVTLLLSAGWTWAQEAPQSAQLLPGQDAAQLASQETAQQPAEPQLVPNELEQMRNFEPAPDAEYRLGRGDEITVDFAGRPDMNAKLVIGPDGRITLPLAGDILLAGLTRPEAAEAIAKALAPYYMNLSVQVTVTKYTSNQVLVLGAVTKPGLVTFDGTPTLLGALTSSGMGLGPGGTAQIPERCAIYRGQNEVIWVDVKKLVEAGNGLANLRLERGDVVYVPSMAEQFVSVLGQVEKPGAVPLTSDSTLVSILAEAGGFTANAGNTPHIQIVDPNRHTTRVLSMKDLLKPAKSQEATLRPGDIIYVPQTGFARTAYVLSGLSPLITALSFGLFTGGL